MGCSSASATACARDETVGLLIAQGWSVREAAEEVGVSPSSLPRAKRTHVAKHLLRNSTRISAAFARR